MSDHPNSQKCSVSVTNIPRHSFLNGIEWACGDLNVHLKGPEAYQLMKSRASKRGMTAPGQVVAYELDQSRLQVMMYESRQRSQKLLLPEEHDDEVAAEAMRELEEIAYESE